MDFGLKINTAELTAGLEFAACRIAKGLSGTVFAEMFP
jgi:hypothetical protein